MIGNESGKMLRYNAVITLIVIMLMSIIQIVETIPTPYMSTHNETVTFDFYVQDVTNMCAWQIKFEFNPKELEPVEFTASKKGYFLHDFASKHNHQTFKVYAVLNRTERTYILAAECILGWLDAQASGSGKLCSFTFKKLVATSNPTITLIEDLEDTLYLDHRGSHRGSLIRRPLPVFMNISESPVVETVPTPYIPANNETVTFDFYVQDVIDMYGWEIRFEFNPKELEFVEFTTSQKGYFLYDFASKYNHPTVKVGMVFNKTGLTYMQAGECISSWFGAQASGSGKLCSFTFKKLVATSEPTITLMEDLEDTYYCTLGGRNFHTRVDKPLPIFMNVSEP